MLDPAMDRRALSVTTLLIAANVAAFAFEIARVGSGLVGGGGSLAALEAAGALVPWLVLHEGEYWRLVTGGFLHGSIMHLAVNMYSLHVLGRFIEAIAGARRMAIVYGVSLFGSSLAVVLLGSPDDVTVGASGAIFGLFGALFAFGFRLGPAGLRLVRANLPILAINLFITFAVPGISRWGHIGGLVTGFIVAWAIVSPPRAVPRV